MDFLQRGYKMKREHGGDDYGRQKRQKADGFSEALAQGKFELRMLISSKCAGAVIGKGGENIKRIRTTFEGQISIPDSNTPERVLTMVADTDTVIEMLKDVMPRLEEGMERTKREARLLVHQSHAGALIGRQGAKIKDLREKSNTHVKIYQQPAPLSTDRIVLISGDDEPVIDCVRMIVHELKEIPIKGVSTPYSSFNYDPSLVNDYGGYSPNGFAPPQGGRGGPGHHGGAGGGGGGGGRGYSGGSGGGPPMGGGMMGGPPPPRGGGGYGGSSMMGMGAPGPVPPVPPPNYMGGMQGGMQGGGMYGAPGAPPRGGGGYGAAPGSFAPQGPIQTTQVTIPSDLGGTIIGRNGERINRIREESGASIVLEAPNGQEERIITISGTENQIHAAQYLLQQCVRSSAQGQKYYSQHR